MEYSYQTYIKMIVVGTLFLGALDMFWLGFVQKNFYKAYLGSIMRDNLLLSHKLAAVIVWALIVIGCIMYVLPNIKGRTLPEIYAQGILYGSILYGVYNFTNYAILSTYTWQLVLADTTWGAFASGALTILLYYIS